MLGRLDVFHIVNHRQIQVLKKLAGNESKNRVLAQLCECVEGRTEYTKLINTYKMDMM